MNIANARNGASYARENFVALSHPQINYDLVIILSGEFLKTTLKVKTKEIQLRKDSATWRVTTLIWADIL